MYHHSDIIISETNNTPLFKEGTDMMRNDIQINGNTIGGRQGWAYVCNSMDIAVLKADLDKKQEYDDYKTFGDVRVIWNYRGTESTKVGTLEVENGKWGIGSAGCMLKAHFGFHDMMTSIEESNLPIIRANEVVAIALYSKENEVATLNLFRVGKVDINCMTVARLTPLSDEEMQEVKKDADRWCNR